MKRQLLKAAFCILFSSLGVACASPQQVPAAPAQPPPRAEVVVLEGFGGGAEPLFFGEIAPAE